MDNDYSRRYDSVSFVGILEDSTVQDTSDCRDTLLVFGVGNWLNIGY